MADLSALADVGPYEEEEEEEEPVDFGTCVVNADDVGAARANGCAGAPRFQAGLVRSAVEGLQAAGLNVILVSNRDLAQFLTAPAPTVDRARLLHVHTSNEPLVDVLLCADRYRCPFLTNEDVGALLGDWRLPRATQRWLRRDLRHLHIGWRVNEAGHFGALFPAQVREHIQQAGRLQHARQAPRQGAPASIARLDGALAAQAEVLAAGPQPGPGAARGDGAVCTPAAWLGGLESEAEMLHTKGLPTSSSQDADDEWPPLVLLCPGQGRRVVLCMLCTGRSKGLFPYAAELMGYVFPVNCNYCESDADEDLQAGLSDAKGPLARWDCDLYTTLTVRGGMHDGLRAAGFGTSAEKRRRAARLALAAAARSCMDAGGGRVENPSGDGEFYRLVSRAQMLFARRGLASECYGARVAEPVALRLQPPPPPPPPGPPPPSCAGAPGEQQDIDRFYGGPDRWRDVQWDRPSVAQDWQALPLPPPPETTAPPAAAPKQPSLLDKLVTAVAAYDAESQGYLPLRCGDRVRLRWHRCEPPGPRDHFGSYIFGELLDPPAATVASGWFPFDLVRFG